MYVADIHRLCLFAWIFVGFGYLIYIYLHSHRVNIYPFYTCIHTTYYWFYITIIPYYACSVYIIDTSGPIAHLIIYSSTEPTEQLHGSKEGINQIMFQHNPGTYPRPSTSTWWRNFIHFRGWGGIFCWGMFWGALPRQIGMMNFRNRSIQARGAGKVTTYPGPNWAAPSAFMLRGNVFIYSICVFFGGKIRTIDVPGGFMQGNPFIFGFRGQFFLGLLVVLGSFFRICLL